MYTRLMTGVCYTCIWNDKVYQDFNLSEILIIYY